ncbi:shikimate dehydrogenase [Methylobacterium trifolii]|uniref:Shikimate dehydrogenase (NADP(+)) n=1 Tax=Methylobacterium trifolii TaxID=1003092 RepID=A0ABQ4TWD5_9HYPH|nr:shikimate dehydrogenase [Methylobacterium trifolii]GJE59578.1 Quinate/shikimate dehydrogenase (NAD(+)) [Methylobacterium trifolii]
MTRYAERRSVLLGLIGQDIQNSRTPEMQMREGAAQGLRLVYRLMDLTRLGLGVEALPELLRGAERAGFDGLNITHPCKQAVIPHLDELSDDARSLGAVNTVVFRDGKRIGHNTDWSGFFEPFRREMSDVPVRRVVQIGAGGAGAAVAHAALMLGVEELTIVDIDPARAASVAANLTAHFGAGRARAGTELAASVAAADGLINATPIGMDAHPGLPLPAEFLRPDLWVAEVIYFPLETELLRRARALGARTIGGGGMAVFQAVAAFRLFTGIEPDSDRMIAAFASMGSA